MDNSSNQQALIERLNEGECIFLSAKESNRLLDYMVDTGYDAEDYRMERDDDCIAVWAA